MRLDPWRKEHFVGLDLADDEGLPAQPFAPCSKAKAQGLGITVHAGEPNVPGAPKNILVALDELGADRIGHGVQAIKDDRVVERLAREGVVLELCPTSNVLTQAVSSVGEHPIQSLMHRGVRTTINTDDPGVMGLTLMDECMALKRLGMTLEHIHQCNEWAREASSFQHPRFNLMDLETPLPFCCFSCWAWGAPKPLEPLNSPESHHGYTLLDPMGTGNTT